MVTAGLLMMKTAEKEIKRLGGLVLQASPKEKKRIRRRLVWLSNMPINPRVKMMYKEAYKTIKI